jgi:hypothetical protein
MKHPLVCRAVMAVTYAAYTAMFFGGLWASLQFLQRASTTVEIALTLGLTFVFVDRLLVYVFKAARQLLGDD